MNKFYLVKLLAVFLIFNFSFLISFAQDTIKIEIIKSAKDIPHKTLWQKWMWIHRTIAFNIIKERPVFFDTTYIKTYKKSFVVAFPLSTRYLAFSLIDGKTKNQLDYSPNDEYDLGLSINSHWASFLVNTGVKVFYKDNDIKGKTKYQDYQFNLYGKKFTTDAFFQYYQGFYIKNSRDYPDYISDKPYAIRKDANAFTLGLSMYYIFKYKKFSYRNSFAFTETQKKSAGSFIAGGYFSLFAAWSDTTLVPFPFKASFDSSGYIRVGSSYSIGRNAGYIQTLVFLKKCYMTFSVIPGLGYEQTTYTREDNSTYKSETALSSKVNVRLATGYNTGNFYTGAMVMTDYFLFSSKTLDTKFNYAIGKLRVFVGYRFSYEKAERKLLRKLNLIDYRL